MTQKRFASHADVEEKTVSFDRLSEHAYAYTAEGDPNTGIVIGDDGVMVIDAQATPVMAQDVVRRIREVTDLPIRYVTLSHYHAVRVLGASAYFAEGATEIIASQGTPDASPWHTIWIIVRQLLLPFVARQLLRPLLLRPLGKHPRTVKFVDQVSILLVVYTAFSAAVTQGLWHEVPGTALAGLVIVDVVLLVLALSLTGLVARHLGFNEADRITIVFCGSKKSLAAGIPMANVIFAGHAVGTVLLPLMLFHQIQLMTCAVLARRWGARQD